MALAFVLVFAFVFSFFFRPSMFAFKTLAYAYNGSIRVILYQQRLQATVTTEKLKKTHKNYDFYSRHHPTWWAL